MKKLSLTNGGFTLIDNDIYDLVINYNWRRDSLANHVVRTEGPKKNRRLVRLHRFIMDAKKGQLVDHINGNVLDNRRKNLRIANKSSNGMNRGKQKNNKSGYKGVCWHPAANKWSAQLVSKGKKVLNSFHTSKKEAAKAYNAAALKYHGKFARLNKGLK